MNATYTITKTGRNFTVTYDDLVVATKKTKALAQAWVESQFTAPADTGTNQENQVTDETLAADQDTDAPQTDAPTEQADAAPEQTDAAPEPAPLSPEEQAALDKKVARSEKLRAAMFKVLEDVKAGNYDPSKTHPNLKSNKGLNLQLADSDDVQMKLQSVLHHRAIASFSDKSLVDGVTLDGQPVAAARTKGTWAGITRSFLWIEAPAMAFPPSLVGSTKRATVTFHLLIENADFDNLENAAVTTNADPVQAPTEAKAPKADAAADTAPEQAAPATDAPTDAAPEQAAPATDDTPAPAKRKGGKARPAPEAQA